MSVRNILGKGEQEEDSEWKQKMCKIFIKIRFKKICLNKVL